MSQLGVNPSTEGDKVAKDDNFRGETVYNNVLYYTKGSGSNGVDTVYFVDTTGKACPSGVGLPEPGAPTTDVLLLTYDATAGGTITKKGKTTDNPGLVPENMCILNGFPTSLAHELHRRERLPIRDVVRQSDHAVRGRRRRR